MDHSVAAVEAMGLEPTTPCLQSRCSSQLSYAPGGLLSVGASERGEEVDAVAVGVAEHGVALVPERVPGLAVTLAPGRGELGVGRRRRRRDRRTRRPARRADRRWPASSRGRTSRWPTRPCPAAAGARRAGRPRRGAGRRRRRGTSGRAGGRRPRMRTCRPRPGRRRRCEEPCREGRSGGSWPFRGRAVPGGAHSSPQAAGGLTRIAATCRTCGSVASRVRYRSERDRLDSRRYW